MTSASGCRARAPRFHSYSRRSSKPRRFAIPVSASVSASARSSSTPRSTDPSFPASDSVTPECFSPLPRATAYSTPFSSLAGRPRRYGFGAPSQPAFSSKTSRKTAVEDLAEDHENRRVAVKVRGREKIRAGRRPAAPPSSRGRRCVCPKSDRSARSCRVPQDRLSVAGRSHANDLSRTIHVDVPLAWVFSLVSGIANAMRRTSRHVAIVSFAFLTTAVRRRIPERSHVAARAAP